jgi:hypothetical protein
MNKGKNFTMMVPIYPVDLMVSVAETDDQLVKAVNKWLSEESDKVILTEAIRNTRMEPHGIVYELDGAVILRMYKLIKTPEDHGYLAHEIFHVVEKLAFHIGLKHCEKSSEAFAYLISYLTTEIYKKL